MSLLADRSTTTTTTDTCPTCGHELEPVVDEFSRSYGFDEFWAIYPKRNTNGTLIKPGKALAKQKWGRFPLATKRLIYKAVINYGFVQQPEYIKDASRFLSAEYWRDWLEVTVNDAPASEPRCRVVG